MSARSVSPRMAFAECTGNGSTFLNRSAVRWNSFYRTEFRAAHPGREVRLPAVFISQGNGLELLIESDEIKACGNLEELMLFTRRKVEWACPGRAKKEFAR